MRVIWLVALAAVGVGIALAADPAETPQKGLLVHEWGVINVYNDVELANADMRAVWESLPPFIYGNVDRRRVPRELVQVFAPVMYFHTPAALQVQVKVEFLGGRPAVWWPANSNIPRYTPRGMTQATCDKHLEWQLKLITPNDSTFQQPLPKDHWLSACRAVKAADVFATVPGDREEEEKFVYYDGFLASPKTAELGVAADQVSLTNRARHPLRDVTVVDRRVPGTIRVARVATVAAAAEVKALEFKDVAAERWPAAAVNELVSELTGAGLHEDEARAMAAVWKKDFFETEGLTLFYRLPAAEYDRLLPLTVRPRPEKIVRVMLVHHPHCEPDLSKRVMALVEQLDSGNFQERLDAHRRINALGRAAFVHLVRARNAKPSLEVTARLNKLLEAFESERAFRPGGAADE
jgi:hypothetical protein